MSQETRTRPFPWKCGNCRETAVFPAVIPYETEAAHDGRVHQVSLPALRAPRCTNCGELVMTDDANGQIDGALRDLIGLLKPEEIREHREALGLTQRQLANQLGIAEATLSRWETGGQIQQRAMDNLLRIYFNFGDVRSALSAKAALKEQAAT